MLLARLFNNWKVNTSSLCNSQGIKRKNLNFNRCISKLVYLAFYLNIISAFMFYFCKITVVRSAARFTSKSVVNLFVSLNFNEDAGIKLQNCAVWIRLPSGVHRSSWQSDPNSVNASFHNVHLAVVMSSGSGVKQVTGPSFPECVMGYTISQPAWSTSSSGDAIVNEYILSSLLQTLCKIAHVTEAMYA